MRPDSKEKAVLGIGSTSNTEHRTPNTRRLRRRGGYTLIEMLVAVIMFAFITLATGFALSAALRGQQQVRNRADEIQEVRTLFEVVGKDIRSAYASAANPNTFFYAPGNEAGPMLTFSTLSHRIKFGQTDTQADQTFGSMGIGSTEWMGPQSDVGIVNYTFDDTTGTLMRSETVIPTQDSQPQPQSQAELEGQILSRNIRAIRFDFLQIDTSSGTTNSTWREEWSFTNDAAQQNSQAAQGAQTGAAPVDTASVTGDVQLPNAVRITVEIANPIGPPRRYETTIGIPNPVPQPKGQVPDPPVTASTGNNGGGNNNGGTGGNPGGNTGGNSGGGAPLPGIPGLGGGAARP